jgi:hypothetical protein
MCQSGVRVGENYKSIRIKSLVLIEEDLHQRKRKGTGRE